MNATFRGERTQVHAFSRIVIPRCASLSSFRTWTQLQLLGSWKKSVQLLLVCIKFLAIEIYFDAETDDRIRVVWEKFASIGLVEVWGEEATEVARPHVSMRCAQSFAAGLANNTYRGGCRS